jgi:hypothetical protein
VIQFHCPTCGAGITTIDDAAGRRGKCIACGKIVSVPATATGAASSDANDVPAIRARVTEDRAVAVPATATTPSPTTRCPSCGNPTSDLDTRCSACGSDLPQRGSYAAAIEQLNHEMALLDQEQNQLLARQTGAVDQAQIRQRIAEAKKGVIERITIPNTKDAILEMLSVAVGRGDVGWFDAFGDTRAVVQAWRSKAKQLLAKATVFAVRDPDYARLIAPFSATVAGWQRDMIRFFLFGLACMGPLVLLVIVKSCS